MGRTVKIIAAFAVGVAARKLYRGLRELDPTAGSAGTGSYDHPYPDSL